MPKTLKGMKRPEGAGRQKGSLNKKTVVKQSLEEKCQARGIDIFDMMLEYLTQPCPMDMRFAVMKELIQYLHPKLSATKVDGQIDMNLVQQLKEYETMPTEKLIELTKEEIKKLSDE